ncbi:hypothetical protein ACLQ25_08695 [Micromonospora sp. DT44]|uniref:hypothetical protein n=1 Tax=Micromonospora sp. DT44 TaxID=3393439 RepID=UPI003CE67863
MVEDLAINPNTVAKAYRQMEQESLVTGRPGQGTFVDAQQSAVMSASTYTSLRRGDLAAPRLRGRPRRAGGRRALHVRPPADQE